MNFRNSRNLMTIGFVVGILTMVVGLGFENEKTIVRFLVGGTIIFLVALVQAFIFYLCPHCGYSLMNVRGGVPDHCPNCGKKLK